MHSSIPPFCRLWNFYWVNKDKIKFVFKQSFSFFILEDLDAVNKDTKWSWKTVDEKIEFPIGHDIKEITKDYRFCLSGEVSIAIEIVTYQTLERRHLDVFMISRWRNNVQLTSFWSYVIVRLLLHNLLFFSQLSKKNILRELIFAGAEVFSLIFFFSENSWKNWKLIFADFYGFILNENFVGTYFRGWRKNFADFETKGNIQVEK